MFYLDAAICTGTVFGIFESNEDTGEEGVDDVVVGGGDGSYTGSKRDDSMVQAVLQPAKIFEQPDTVFIRALLFSYFL